MKVKCIDCNYRYRVGRSVRCNICKRKRARDRQHNAHLKRKYGITIEDYYAMLELQQGSCAICDGGTSKNYLATDHDHTTGEVRGLLCARCNKVLRDFRDTIARFLRAADYLENPPARLALGEREWMP